MPDQEIINDQLRRLHTCRRTLAQYLHQRATFGDAYAPPVVLNGIDEMRLQIHGIKQALRAWNVFVEDLPDDGELQVVSLPQRSPLSSKHRVFISYKRQAIPDETLALRIYDALLQAGHKPFIDQTMQVGADWAATIEQAIAESDFFIVLLSSASVHSEMIAEEVATSARVTRATGHSRLLPVRLNYKAALPYQLSRDLNHLQYAAWDSHDDTPLLLGQLLAAVEQQALLPHVQSETVITPPPGDAPLPYADPRFLASLVEPGGGMKLQASVYIERDTDIRLHHELSKQQGTTTTIRASRQTGKTSLLIRGIAQAQQGRRKSILIDMQMVEPRFLESLDTFLYYLAILTANRLQLDIRAVEGSWNGPLGAPDKFTYFFEDYVLALDAPVVLAIDEADRLLSAPFRDSFFGLLRAWHNSRAINELWDKLSLLLVISTEPSLLIADLNQSPFNVGTKLVLGDLNAAQVAELNRRYRSPVNDPDLPALINLLGGHPYLTSKALYTMVTDAVSWEVFAHVASLSGGPFGDHLRSYLALLQRYPELRVALVQVATSGICRDEQVFYRLVQSGLVQGINSQQCAIRCDLYHRYLKEVLL